MGRTLHYSILKTKHSELTEEQYVALFDLERKFNREYNWTCENVGFNIYSYFPNWQHKTIIDIRNRTKPEKNNVFSGSDNVWSYLTIQFEELLGTEYDQAPSDKLISAIKKLQERGLISFAKDVLSDDYVRGFTKVSSNELNAIQVVKFVLEASKLVPDKEFVLDDEGDCLYCPLLIKNGLAKPDKIRMTANLEYWKDKDYLHDEGRWDVTSKEIYFKQLLKKNKRFGDINQYIRPIKTEAILSKRKEFETMLIDTNENINFFGMIDNFLNTEFDESLKYYDDIKSYPTIV